MANNKTEKSEYLVFINTRCKNEVFFHFLKGGVFDAN